jgi:type IV pilus assembly protein PilA
MSRKLERLARGERGFTLSELLVVILIIGVLAAIVVPMFLNKSQNAEDAEAKSNARNLMSHMDSCFVPSEDFTKCTTQVEIGANDLPWGTNPGQVSVTDTTEKTYEIVAVSKDGHEFKINRSTAGDFDRTCNGGAGCRNGEW